MTEIQGKAINNSTLKVKDVVIDMVFYDKNWVLLNKFERPSTPSGLILKPSESHSFNFSELVSSFRINTSNVTAGADIKKWFENTYLIFYILKLTIFYKISF